jgi:hypothetical protein
MAAGVDDRSTVAHGCLLDRTFLAAARARGGCNDARDFVSASVVVPGGDSGAAGRTCTRDVDSRQCRGGRCGDALIVMAVFPRIHPWRTSLTPKALAAVPESEERDALWKAIAPHAATLPAGLSRSSREAERRFRIRSLPAPGHLPTLNRCGDWRSLFRAAIRKSTIGWQ